MSQESGPPSAVPPPPSAWGSPQGAPPPHWEPPGSLAPRVGTTNGFAIASLVLGLLGGILLSVIFGVIALRQIPRRGQQGRGLAVGGLVASGLWTVAIVVVIFWVVISGPTRNESGEIVEAGTLGVEELRVGDCLVDLPEGDVAMGMTGVPCAEPHDGQVYAAFDLTAPDWPGAEEAGILAEDGCFDRVSEYPGEWVELFMFHPTEESWQDGDRQVVCIALVAPGLRG